MMTLKIHNYRSFLVACGEGKNKNQKFPDRGNQARKPAITHSKHLSS